eukprot:scaffold240_cov369-Pavlova_lutheri.AAC.35
MGNGGRRNYFCLKRRERKEKGQEEIFSCCKSNLEEIEEKAGIASDGRVMRIDRRRDKIGRG